MAYQGQPGTNPPHAAAGNISNCNHYSAVKTGEIQVLHKLAKFLLLASLKVDPFDLTA